MDHINQLRGSQNDQLNNKEKRMRHKAREKQRVSLDTVLTLSATTKRLDGLFLEGLVLDRMNFDGVSFQKSFLAKCSFIEGSIIAANFTNADLLSCVLDRVMGNNALFSGNGIALQSAKSASLVGSTWKDIEEISFCDFREADLSGAVFENVKFTFCDFRNTNLSRTTWINCFIDECKMSDANFENADVSGLEFYQHKGHALQFAVNTMSAKGMKKDMKKIGEAIRVLQVEMNNQKNQYRDFNKLGVPASWKRALLALKEAIGVESETIDGEPLPSQVLGRPSPFDKYFSKAPLVNEQTECLQMLSRTGKMNTDDFYEALNIIKETSPIDIVV